MRVVSWNIRAGGGRRIVEITRQLQAWTVDVVALSEFRGTPPSQQLAQWLADDGLCYQLTTINEEKRAVNALLLASRYPLTPVTLDTAPNESTRWLLAQVEAPQPFTLGVMHVPNYHTGRKIPYHDAVLDCVNAWSLGPAMLVGDTNTGLNGIDDVTRVFTAREEQWMHRLADAGWADGFRHFHGAERVYTWYSPNAGNGFRLDQAFINAELIDAVSDVHYAWGQSDEQPDRRDALSDHAAMLIELKE